MNLRRAGWIVTAWYTGILLTIVLVLTVGAFPFVSHELADEMDETLLSAAEGIAARVSSTVAETGDPESLGVSEPLVVAQQEESQPTFLAGGRGDTYYLVLSPSGEVLNNPLSVRSEVYQDFRSLNRATTTGVAWSSTNTSFGEYRRIFYTVYKTPVDENEMPIDSMRFPVAVVEVGRSMAEYQSELRTLTLIVASIGIGGLVLATVGGLFVSRRALEPARVAFERQRQFLADASHELRSPLTLIRASTEAVLLSSRKNLAAEDQESLDDVLSESDRMAELIEDLLLLARLEDKRLQPHAEDFDLSQLLVESARWARSVLANNGTRLTLSSPQALPVRCEREQIVRVLRSILENAIRYTPKGGEITLAGSIKDDEVRVTVQDTGPGVAPEELQLVFERFYRADPSRTRISGGTGLGLAIAKGLVENAGGRIWAEAAPVNGAVFTFSLPLRANR